MTAPTYREQLDAKRIQQIREITRALPPACGDFLRAIAMTTGTFTRLGYALDLRTFFNFLQRERVQFADKPLYAFTDADLASVSTSDLTAYTDYLTFYLKQVDTTENADEERVLINHELAIKRKLCSLRALYGYLFQLRRIPSNVTELVPLPKIHEKPILRLSQEEVSQILSQAASGDQLTDRQQKFHERTARRDYAILELLLGTGIRVSECVGLNIGDLDMAQNAFLVTRKGGNQVILYFPPEVAKALEMYLEERQKEVALPGHEDALFLSLQKRRITDRAVQKLVKKYAAVAAPLKPRISPHKLRSTFATNLYNQTGDIYLVADVLGHSSVDTTRKHYADMTDEHRRLAAQNVTLPTFLPTAAPEHAAEATEAESIPADETAQEKGGS